MDHLTLPILRNLTNFGNFGNLEISKRAISVIDGQPVKKISRR